MDTSAPVPKQSTPNCTGLGCADCLKGGMPFKREWLSLFLVLSLIVVTVLGVLLVQAKRESKQLMLATEKVAQPVATASASPFPKARPRIHAQVIPLPKPVTDGKLSLEKAIATRRTRREFSAVPVTLAQISQMVWSGQGQTDPSGKRTVPSARESYSMVLFVFVKSAAGIAPGLYEYLPATHALGALQPIDLVDTMKNAGAQEGAQNAPVVFLIASDLGVYQEKTKSTSVTATYMEAGHISQNMYLMAESLGMGTVTMAGFSSPKMASTLKLDPAFSIQYIMPFGHRVVASGSATVSE